MLTNINHQRKFQKAQFLLIVTLIALLLSGCGGANSPKTYTIGLVNVSVNLEPLLESFKAGLAEAGYVEGKNVTYIYDGPVSADALPSLLENLKAKKVDLVYTLGTPASLQAKKNLEGTDIPIVFSIVNDPVKSGIVLDVLKPGGNITGVQLGSVIFKRVEWLLAVAPGIKRLDVIHNPTDAGSVQGLAELTKAAAQFNLELKVREASTTEEITAAVNYIPDDVDGIFILPATTITSQVKVLIKVANERKLPLSAPAISDVQDGGLTSFGWESKTLGQQAARMADQVLRGAKTSDLPIETADSVLGLNMKTANLIGLNIPADVIRQAIVIVR